MERVGRVMVSVAEGAILYDQKEYEVLSKDGTLYTPYMMPRHMSYTIACEDDPSLCPSVSH